MAGHGGLGATTIANRHAISGDALIIVDVQNDFLPGGTLAVPGGDAVISALNLAISKFVERDLPIVATRDWHPVDHCSFAPQGGPWPPHCVADTTGAAFHERLQLPEDVEVISKATETDRDAYSGFDGTKLADWLESRQIRRIVVGGLATDYCVKATVIDGLKAGFAVRVLADGIRAVNVEPGDGEKAIEAIVSQGAELISSSDL